MTSLDKALVTQLKNLQERTGKTLPDLYSLIRASSLNQQRQRWVALPFRAPTLGSWQIKKGRA
jgi:hypothetical protein